MLLEQEIEFNNIKVHHSQDYQVAMEEDGDKITIYETGGTSAHCLRQFIKMAEAFRLNYYFSVYERKDGLSIPAIEIL